MLNSVVLDVAIGMAFVYLLLSLVGSVVLEILSTFLQLRSANLERGLRSLFSGDKIGSGLDLVESIYDHGLVRALYQDPTMDLKDPANRAARATTEKVHLLESKLYAAKKAFDEAAQDGINAAALKASYDAALAEVAAAMGELENANAAVKERSHRFLDDVRHLLRWVIGAAPAKEMKTAIVANPILLPAYIPSATFAEALIDTLNKNKLQGKDAMEAIVQSLAAEHWQFHDNKAAQALLALALKSEGKLTRFQTEIEAWYNAGMDRASGWYKRHTQNILLATGLALAILFNVDSLRVARTLWTDRDVRQGMIGTANGYIAKHPDTPGTPVASSSFNAQDMKKQMSGAVDQFNSIADANLLPVGWKYSLKESWGYVYHDPGLGFIRLLGWFITAMAISAGAPFWFDTLNKFMIVRGTVKPAEKSKAESSKDG